MAGTAVVTGGSGQIGTAICLALARDGFDICVNFLNDEKGAGRTVATIRSAGGRAVAVRADVRSEDDVQYLFQAAMDQLGQIVVLVNNAGIIGGQARVDEVSVRTLKLVVETNVLGAFLCAREAVPCMSTRCGNKGGSIINISSRASMLGNAGEWVHYAATKGAIDTLTIGLAREVAEEGIRVNAVRPGLIATDIHAEAGLPDRLERLRDCVPMRRAGTAEEVAAAVRFLVSNDASYLTGVLLDVSGGR